MPRRKADAQENIEKKQDAKTQPKEEKQQGIEEIAKQKDCGEASICVALQLFGQHGIRQGEKQG